MESALRVLGSMARRVSRSGGAFWAGLGGKFCVVGPGGEFCIGLGGEFCVGLGDELGFFWAAGLAPAVVETLAQVAVVAVPVGATLEEVAKQ